jgi:hypothetical protein
LPIKCSVRLSQATEVVYIYERRGCDYFFVTPLNILNTPLILQFPLKINMDKKYLYI